jgi:hypothetical protein
MHGSTGRGWKRSRSYRASPSPNHPRTRTSGSEVRAGETDRPKGRHRAPVRPYSLSWLSYWRRLQVRWDRDAGRWFAFVLLACAVCFNRL